VRLRSEKSIELCEDLSLRVNLPNIKDTLLRKAEWVVAVGSRYSIAEIRSNAATTVQST
jgi:hypothetical protein